MITTLKQLKDAINEIRQLVYELRPPILDELGLTFAINELITQYSHSEIKFQVNLCLLGYPHYLLQSKWLLIV